VSEPSTEELLATVREAIDEACVHDTDHAGAYPALDTLAARLEAAGRQHVDDRHDLQRLAGEVSYRRYPPPFDKTDLILLVLLILLGVIAALRIFR